MKLHFFTLTCLMAIFWQVKADENQSILATNVKSVEKASIKKDSTVTYSFVSESDSVFISKTVYGYSDDSLQNCVTVYQYDSVTETWVYDRLDSTFYDDLERNTMDISYDWDTTDLTWILYRKTDYVRNGDSVTRIQSKYDNALNDWIPDYKTINQYDPALRVYIIDENYLWNTSMNSWKGLSKSRLIYDESGNHLRDTTFNWNNDLFDWGEKNITYYDAEGNDSTTITYQWDLPTQQWKKYSKSDTKHYYDGENHFVENMFCFWNNDHAEYDSVYKRVRYIYGNSIETDYYQHVTHMPENISEWIQKEKSEFTYNNDGRIDTVLTFSLNNEQLWDTSKITSFEYFEDGTYSFYESYYSYDTNTHLFQHGSKSSRTKDSEGNNIKSESYSFNGSSQQWIGTSKTISDYGDSQRQEFYIWDYGLNDWMGQYAYENYVNEDGNTYKFVDFDWISGEWQLSTKQFYYYSAFEESNLQPNNAPTIDPVSDQTISLETVNVDITGISDGDEDTQNLTIAANSDNENVATVNVSYTEGNAGTINITGISEGTAVITILVKDDGGTSQEGIDSVKVNFTVSVSIPSSVYDNTKPNIQVYPNPATDIIQIEGLKVNSVEILSSGGSVMATYYNSNIMDISEFSNGIYILKVISDDQSVNYFRIIKE